MSKADGCRYSAPIVELRLRLYKERYVRCYFCAGAVFRTTGGTPAEPS